MPDCPYCGYRCKTVPSLNSHISRDCPSVPTSRQYLANYQSRDLDDSVASVESHNVSPPEQDKDSGVPDDVLNDPEEDSHIPDPESVADPPHQFDTAPDEDFDLDSSTDDDDDDEADDGGSGNVISNISHVTRSTHQFRVSFCDLSSRTPSSFSSSSSADSEFPADDDTHDDAPLSDGFPDDADNDDAALSDPLSDRPLSNGDDDDDTSSGSEDGPNSRTRPSDAILQQPSAHYSANEINPLDGNQIAAAELLSISHRCSASLGLFDDVREWARKHFGANIPSRVSSLDSFFTRYNLHGLKPQEHPVFLPAAKKSINVVVNDIESCIYSLLTNPALMQPQNLLFDAQNPLGDHGMVDESLTQAAGCSEEDHVAKQELSDRADFDTGVAYKMGLSRYSHTERDQLLPTVLFIDGTPIDMHGNLTLEPVMMTLACFNRATRQRPEAWVPIGFLRKVPISNKGGVEEDLVPDNTQQTHLQKDVKGTLQDYHAMLTKILDPLSRVQASGISWNWSLSSSTLADCDVILRPDLLVVEGDAPGLDKLVGLKGGAGNPCCRRCNCSFDNLDSSSCKLKFTKMSDIQEWACGNQRFARTSRSDPLGYHPLKSNPFYKIRFCYDAFGINGSTPSEILHQKSHGIDKYAITAYTNLQVS